MSIKKLLCAVLLGLAVGTNAFSAPDAMKGKFIARYSKPANPNYIKMHQEFIKHKILESIVNVLNSSFGLPKSISITMAECGQPNAFFDPSRNSITLCYELIADFAQQSHDMQLAGDTAEKYLSGSLIFVLLHELGHALISVLSLPITGKEEDAADQLATYVLLESENNKDFEKNAEVIVNALVWFKNIGQGQYSSEHYADEHSLSEQRFFNVLCWMYGADPASFSEFVTKGLLPENRAARCPGEYQQLVNSWGQLLAPYQKD